MATYTNLDHNGIQACLDEIPLGKLISYTTASHGIENSNYLLTVNPAAGDTLIDCVLTVYEGLPKQQVEVYTQCLNLWGKTLPVPRPLQAAPEAVPSCPDKVFVISTRLAGDHILQPNANHCRQMGEFLAQFHLVAQATSSTFIGPRCLPWVLAYSPASPYCSVEDSKLFKHYQAHLSDLPEALKACPQGWVHGDLFPDNALFKHDHLSGVIDFNNACCDTLLFDLCITLNAWSSLGIEQSCPERYEAMLTAYYKVRPLTEHEQAAMDHTLLAAALRFWASRIDFLRDTGGKPGKEPEEYRRIAQQHAKKLGL
jgi:homoserine kinase type II